MLKPRYIVIALSITLALVTIGACEEAVHLTVLNETNEEITVFVNGRRGGVVPPLANKKLENTFFPDSSFLIVAYDRSGAEISRQMPLYQELIRTNWRVEVDRGRPVRVANLLSKNIKLYIDGIGRDHIKAGDTVQLNGVLIYNSLGEHLVEAQDIDRRVLFSRVISETLMASNGWLIVLEDRK